MWTKFGSNTFISLLLVILLIIFGSLLLYSAFYVDLGFDPAYHATVAKNFASGHGYVTSYDKIFPLNPDITTGPVMLLFASLVMVIAGNAIWVPAITAAILNLSILVFIYSLLAQYLRQKRHLVYLLVSLSMFFFLFEFHWWSSLRGDFSAVLLSLLALLLLYADGCTRKHIFLAGVCFSLAILTKLTMLLSLVGIVPFLIQHRSDTKRQLLVYVFLFCGALLMIFLPWKLYEFLSLIDLSGEEKTEHYLYSVNFFREQGSGWAELAGSQSLLHTLTENWQRNSLLLRQFMNQRYGLNDLALLGLLCFYALTAAVFFRKNSAISRYLVAALMTVWFVHLLWFYFISASWNAKYALLGISYFFISLILMLSQFRYGFVTPVFVIICFNPSHNIYWPTLKNTLTLSLLESEYREDAQLTKQFVEKNLSQDGILLAGCGWVFAPHVIEYLLPEINNFSDCRRLIKEAIVFNEAHYRQQNKDFNAVEDLANYSSAEQHYFEVGQYKNYLFEYQWQRPLKFYLVADHIYWKSSAYSYRYADILKACAQKRIFTRNYFSIFECDYDALKKYLPLNERTYFLRYPNDFYFVHKPKPLNKRVGR